MPRYVALLRGIAPNGRNMQNDKLRGVVAGLGFTSVGSVISSGNITFATPRTDETAIQQEIEDALLERLGVGSRTIVREVGVLRELLSSNPFGELAHMTKTYQTVTFLRGLDPLPGGLPDTSRAHAQVIGFDAGARAILAVVDNSDRNEASAYMTWLERTFGKDITTRTWLTVQRIVSKLDG